MVDLEEGVQTEPEYEAQEYGDRMYDLEKAQSLSATNTQASPKNKLLNSERIAQ